MRISSTISILPMANGSDFNGVVIFQIEEYPVIAAAETEADERRFQFFHITRPAEEISVQTIKNLQGGLAVDSAEISAGFRGPVDCNAFRRWRFGHFFKPSSRRISS